MDGANAVGTGSSSDCSSNMYSSVPVTGNLLIVSVICPLIRLVSGVKEGTGLANPGEVGIVAAEAAAVGVDGADAVGAISSCRVCSSR